jgi:reverse gyrase
VGWARDVLGIDLWSLQAAVAMSVAENKRTTVQAGHGVGKTFLAAILAL